MEDKEIGERLAGRIKGGNYLDAIDIYIYSASRRKKEERDQREEL